MTELLGELTKAVIDGQSQEAQALLERALGEGVSAQSLIDQALVPAMAFVGERFEIGEYCLPEMMLSARAMQVSMDILQPLLAKANIKPSASIVLGSVKGDLHDIGKNLVGAILRGAGFRVIDLGSNVPPQKFVEAVKVHHVDLLGMSALLTTTMPMMRATIDALTEAGVRDQIKVLIGGAAVTEAYAAAIGADGYAPDASAAARGAKALLAQR
jgi:5-methyltetrahydrofolate--homocysteine methyltransferase